jgi:hypothetical protein
VAAHLQTRPPDLTRIALRHTERFDVDEVTAFIDGRTRVGAHGSADMPVWGHAFDAGFAGSSDPLPLLVQYLESIQVAAEPAAEGVRR